MEEPRTHCLLHLWVREGPWQLSEVFLLPSKGSLASPQTHTSVFSFYFYIIRASKGLSYNLPQTLWSKYRDFHLTDEEMKAERGGVITASKDKAKIQTQSLCFLDTALRVI